MVPFKRVMFSYGFSVVTSKLYLTIHVQYAIECLPRLDQQRVGHFGAKCWGKDWPKKPNFNVLWERHGVVMCKRNRVSIFCLWAQCTNVTDRQITEQ